LLKLLNNLKLFKRLKTQNFKIPTISPGVVAEIHVAGVRGEHCGAVRWIETCRSTIKYFYVF